MMTFIIESVFVACLAIWTGCSILRFVDMYDPRSPFQCWRRWDFFHLVPVGAFFGPRPPKTEQWIMVRDFLPNDVVTKWTEVPRVQSRIWWHSLWNPQKQIYRAKLETARSLVQEAGELSVDGKRISVALLISESYVALLRYVTDLPRLTKPQATQFAVIETDVVTKELVQTVVSAVHEV